MNEYPNIYLLGKWHKYKYEQYSRDIVLKYSNIRIFVLITETVFRCLSRFVVGSSLATKMSVFEANLFKASTIIE